MKNFILFILLCSLFSSSIWAQNDTKTDAKDLDITKNESFQHNLKDDFFTSLDYMVKGSYMQFQGTSNWIILGATFAFMIPYWNSDKRISKEISGRPDHGYEKVISNVGIVANFPIIPAFTYWVGRTNHDEKMIKYSQEYFAALNIALIEASLISFVPLHPRPTEKENLTFWEKNFRYESSFPSGHTVGWSVMAFKTFQYYGPLPALAPAGLAYIASMERVKTDKHYVTDVIGSSVLALLASEGTRLAGKNKDNHPAYKWIFEHEVKVGFLSDGPNYIATVGASF